MIDQERGKLLSNSLENEMISGSGFAGTEFAMNKKTERLLLFSIISIFIALRLAFITQKNLWFDEIFSWNLTLGSFYEILVRTSNDIHPPLYYYVLKIWNCIIGDSVFSMRFLSVIFSAASLLFVYPISRKVLDQNYSFIVLIFFAVNPLNVFYSQEVRMSAMNLFLNAGAVYLFLKLLDLNLSWKAGFKNKFFYLYVIFRTLALYTHYFSFFIFIVEVVLIVLRLRITGRTKLHFALWGLIIILYLPWIPTFIEHITRGQSWRTSQFVSSGFSSFPNQLVDFIKDLNLGLYYHYANLNLIFYITVFLTLFYILFFLLALRHVLLSRLESKVGMPGGELPLLLVVIPLLSGLLLSLTQKVELYRYLSIIIPYVLILIVFSISRSYKKIIVIPSIILLVIVNIYGLVLLYSHNFKNDDYRPIIIHLEKNFKQGDRIYVEPHYNGWVIDFYKKQWGLNLPNPVYIRYGWREIQDSMRVQKPVNFWSIFDYSSVDTTRYGENIKRLKVEYKMQEQETYYLIPARVELYRFTAK